ncbi:MAG: prephenate dehydratase domain-containing protein [Gammaproteobacteria bacterium]
MTVSQTLGISGEPGSFSEEAASRYAASVGMTYEFVYLTDMEKVLAAVAEKRVDFGIFPVVNLRGGLVKMAFEAMGKYPFKLIDDLWLDVHQCLLIKKNFSIADICQVASHPQALAQCQTYLKTLHPIELIEWSDTAQAAKDLAEGKLAETTAVIAPARSAELYGLEVVASNIQDQQPNLTAFIIVKSTENLHEIRHYRLWAIRKIMGKCLTAVW